MWSSSAEVSAKRYRYTGKEKDEESGLYYHGARYYAPWLGRWTAADPAGLVDGLNLYRYSRDNPINFSDPSGTYSKENEAYLATARHSGKTPFASQADQDHWYFQAPKGSKGDGPAWKGELTDAHLDEFRKAGFTPYRYLAPQEDEVEVVARGESSTESAPESESPASSDGEGSVPLSDAVVGTLKPAIDLENDTKVREGRNSEIAAREAKLKESIPGGDQNAIREEAVKTRNEATVTARKQTSKLAEGFAEVVKPRNKLPTVESEVAKRTPKVDEAARKSGKGFKSEALRQEAITRAVVEGSGRGGGQVNSLAKNSPCVREVAA